MSGKTASITCGILFDMLKSMICTFASQTFDVWRMVMRLLSNEVDSFFIICIYTYIIFFLLNFPAIFWYLIAWLMKPHYYYATMFVIVLPKSNWPNIFLPAAKRQVMWWCRSEKRKEVTYGFFAIVASMFGDFQYFKMNSTNYH